MRKAWPWFVLAGLIAGTAAVLHAMGRPWLCACGGLRLWVGDIWSSHCSQHLLDPYSFTHLSHGLLLGALAATLAKKVPTTWRLLMVLGLELAWEVLENSPMVIDRYRQATVSLDYTGDSVLNSMGDVLCCAVGFAIVHRRGLLVALGIFVFTELLLLISIRDNLTLNVLMLAWPSEVVRSWQAAGQGA